MHWGSSSGQRGLARYGLWTRVRVVGVWVWQVRVPGEGAQAQRGQERACAGAGDEGDWVELA
jgi:hypothetical protein